ncbi:MAG: hypothetical protein GYA57_00890, partial [Myxococcales bacterium]|nr:hypothetical protein [Myxococcales bacterium]
MTARWLGILVLLCTAGGTFGCGSARSDDAGDGGGPEDVGDVPDVEDETLPEVEPEDAAGCEGGLTDCGGTCVDLSNDPEHCGRCDASCPGAVHATGVCGSGLCGLRCESGWVDVDGLPGCELACTPAVPPVEACNEVDDDCDGLTDNGTGFDCVHGTVEPCATTCATSGERACDSSCHWTECVPPAETCDNLDQDCDGVADEGLYGVLWNEEAVSFVAGTTTIAYSIGLASEEVGVAHLLATGAATATGQPRLARLRVLDGSQPGAAGALASGSFGSAIAATGSATTLSVVWTTSDGATPRGESAFVRSALLGSGFSLGAPAVIDTSDEQPSSAPDVVRSPTMDVAYAAWVETIAAIPRLEVRSIENGVSPVVLGAVTLATADPPRNPSIALHGDARLLVVWSAGAPGEVRGQRLTTGLEPEGEEMNLSN